MAMHIQTNVIYSWRGNLIQGATLKHHAKGYIMSAKITSILAHIDGARFALDRALECDGTASRKSWLGVVNTRLAAAKDIAETVTLPALSDMPNGNGNGR